MELANELQAVMDKAGVQEARGWQTGKASGGAAFTDLTRAWRGMDLLMLATKLKVAINTLSKTPGYETGKGGRNRPGMKELETGARHLALAISNINKGIKKMQVTTFLEDWDEDDDGLGMDDDVKRKKPTDIKDVEKDVEKEKPPPEETEGMYESRLLGRLNAMTEEL